MEGEFDSDSRPPDRADRPARLSRTPSWVMLGFLLGALAVYAWLRPRGNAPQPPAPPAVSAAPVAETKRDAPVLTTIEAVFATWGENAVWHANTTEIALWNSRDRDFTDFYEVRRIGGVNYFRSIPTLTRRIIRRGKEIPECPLQFTETEEQYREWKEHGRTERPAESAPRRKP
jgi:hypothetical protein